ncbi:hypothetical protein VTJ04DRAFT_8902 [Mycothermus thermophilus]|uniref:uncharacterized protein n=1 Tax=Humicola insolens TaxID=85995 RepID=UPI00374268D1
MPPLPMWGAAPGRWAEEPPAPWEPHINDIWSALQQHLQPFYQPGSSYHRPSGQSLAGRQNLPSFFKSPRTVKILFCSASVNNRTTTTTRAGLRNPKPPTSNQRQPRHSLGVAFSFLLGIFCCAGIVVDILLAEVSSSAGLHQKPVFDTESSSSSENSPPRLCWKSSNHVPHAPLKVRRLSYLVGTSW